MKYDIGHKVPSDSIPGDFYLLDLFHGPILSSMENLENTSKKEENKYHLESHIREQVYILSVFSMTIFTYSLIYMFMSGIICHFAAFFFHFMIYGEYF